MSSDTVIHVENLKIYRLGNVAKGEFLVVVGPSDCRFHPRCPKAQKICSENEPVLEELKSGHFAACYFPYLD